ncbi:hypothetical protein MNB_SUP05-SYMBIONT-4-1364 [hydrothermal vent metagenome]|uniref:Uncharacterized protein n=1 Tax=hydrothermal vent metagenome TaxID=652676 RepID=A0A1W1DXP3_9ZZZZ
MTYLLNIERIIHNLKLVAKRLLKRFYQGVVILALKIPSVL